MKTMVSREARITGSFKPFLDTIEIYRDAVSSIIVAVNERFDEMEGLTSNKAMSYMERLIHSTSKRKAEYPTFDERFPKLPCYLRRSATHTAIAAVTLYRKNLSDWEASDRKRKRPRLAFKRNVMPAFYKGNMFFLDEKNGRYSVRLKLFKDNDWVWHTFDVSQADMRNIQMEFNVAEAKCPVLKKHGTRFSLSFAFETDCKLPDMNGKERRICAVDIGVNNAAVCSVMEMDGTVVARRFIAFPSEEDRLNHMLGERRKAHSRSKCRTHRVNRFIGNHNENLSKMTASGIVKFATENSCSVIVMEHLNSKERVKGSKKERLHLWRKKDIARRVETHAHWKGIRLSTVYVPCTLN